VTFRVSAFLQHRPTDTDSRCYHSSMASVTEYNLSFAIVLVCKCRQQTMTFS